MKTPEQLAARREKMRVYMAERRKDPIQAQKNRDAVKKWQIANREKANASTRAWRIANPDRVKALNLAWRAKQTPEALSEYDRKQYRRYKRAHHLVSTFGITEDQYELMITAQKGKCANSACSEIDKSEKRLAVDHDHKTGKVRALLCDRCNRGIGYLDESPERLRAAADYIDFHRS
jgi:hypothetical protein